MERLFAIQKEVTQSLIEQNNRLRELTQMKDDVVATVSHELRTPITSIRGFVELLLDASNDLTESQVRMLQTIERNVEHLQTGGRGPPGRSRRGSRRAGGLHRARPDACGRRRGARHADLGRGERCRRSAWTPGPEVPIFGDPTRLHQLLGNLLVQRHQVLPAGAAGST